MLKKPNLSSTNYSQLDNIVSFRVLENIFDENSHPEALSYLKVSGELRKDLSRYWDNEKKDDIITKPSFFLFFDDVSQSTPTPEDFLRILQSFGFKK